MGSKGATSIYENLRCLKQRRFVLSDCSISYSSAAQRKPMRGEKSPKELGVTSRFDPSTDERFATRMLISASPRLPPRTTRLRLELVSGPVGFRTFSRE